MAALGMLLPVGQGGLRTIPEKPHPPTPHWKSSKDSFMSPQPPFTWLLFQDHTCCYLVGSQHKELSSLVDWVVGWFSPWSSQECLSALLTESLEPRSRAWYAIGTRGTYLALYTMKGLGVGF